MGRACKTSSGMRGPSAWCVHRDRANDLVAQRRAVGQVRLPRLRRLVVPPKLPPPVNPALMKHAEQRAQDAQNRVADAITRFAGSMTFVYLHVIWFACWIGFGVEDYPYGLLTMIVSLEAIFLSTFVMISQNRADAKPPGHRRPAVADRAGGGPAEPRAPRPLQPDPRADEGGARGAKQGQGGPAHVGDNHLGRKNMFVTPGTTPDFGYTLTREAAQQIARNWWLLLLNGVLLVVAGFLIFSIDWTVREPRHVHRRAVHRPGRRRGPHHRHRRTRSPGQRDRRPAVDRHRDRDHRVARARACSRSRSSSARG